MKKSNFLIYTLEEGGEFQFLGEVTRKYFNQLKRDGFISVRYGDADPVPQKLAFMALAKEIDHWDFVLAKFPSQNGNGKRY